MGHPELAVIVPTRGRPGNVRKVLEAWNFTNAWDVADLVLVVDADDPEIDGYRALRRENLPVNVIEMPVWQPMVHKLNAAALALADDYFALGFAGDDHLPRTINWAQTYLSYLHSLGTGMVHSDDGYQGARLSTEWAVTSDVVLKLGRMVPAPVEHMYCDNSMKDLFNQVDAVKYLPQVRIEHMHPIAGKAETDAQYQRVNHRDQFKKDRAAYEQWRDFHLLSDAAKIKALRPDRPGAPKKGSKKMSRSPFPHHFKQVAGATPEDIGIALADFAMVVPKDQAIVELGVYRGRTALQMAWGAQQGNGAHVWAIDAWDLPGNTYDPPFTDPGTRKWAHYWIQSLGYSNHITLVQRFSTEAASAWSFESPDGKVGLLFVDGDHSYEGARGDILAWSPHLAPGAVIAVDDYGHPDWPGVAQAVDALVAEGVLAPIEIYHDRLAVTRLAPNPEQTKAVTSEGVSPSPVYVQEPGHPLHPLVAGEAPTAIGPSTEVDSLESSWVVADNELMDVEAGTPVTDLSHAQAKQLAKVRGIVLGTRKDKKTETLQALMDGR